MFVLPTTLLYLVSLILPTEAQSRTPLSLNTVASFTNQTSFSIPGQDSLTITVAFCFPTNARVFVSNDTNWQLQKDPGPGGGPNVHEITLRDGLGNWTGAFPSGGALAVNGFLLDASFEVGVSNDDPLHEMLDNLLLFGDSTSNQAIIFSPIFQPAPEIPKPQYPNYTLPSANPASPTIPSNSPNFTLLVSETSNTPSLRTSCFLNSSSHPTAGNIINSSLWLRSPQDGWRTEWLLGGLSPSTNYTAFVIQDSHKVLGPMNFVTKSASFGCTLVHSLPYCPSTIYTIPLPAPLGSNFPIYDSSNLPSEISSQAVGYLTNFTVSLLTFACGRDMYSPIVGCDDCQREYRKWLCTVLFPRCSEPSPSNTRFILPDPSTTGIVNAGATKLPASSTGQVVFSALAPVPSKEASRNPSLPYMSNAYTQLLPCVETCNAVDRACPPFLGFRCPPVNFNGAASYGYGYIDGIDGTERGGVTGAAQDRWGNVWCNTG